MPNNNTHWSVRNINGTTGHRCECGSWIRHWKNATASARALCAVHNCGNDAEVGAHVMVTDGRSSAQWWIAPFCKQHYHKTYTDAMYLKRDVVLVSANRSITCQRADWL